MIGRILLLLTDIEMQGETFWGLLRPVEVKRRRLLYRYLTASLKILMEWKSSLTAQVFGFLFESALL
ncbi:unnamed protein product [Brassica rapa]|uniref:Uncharacterized protein n=1 Tax=Brassica campestris TaxID=3711 RepID=A0A3P5YE14_BRACM|nr:unnamed protein product [Brassica rapa]VDC65847.1 unnamed protein product [Brassica rapa]